MKCVTREELMEMIKTRDVLFSDVYTSGLDGLHVASHLNEHDFMRACLLTEVEGVNIHLEPVDYIENVKTFSMDLEYTGRDGLFDEDAKYAVYENEDIDKLINVLNKIKE